MLILFSTSFGTLKTKTSSLIMFSCCLYKLRLDIWEQQDYPYLAAEYKHKGLFTTVRWRCSKNDEKLKIWMFIWQHWQANLSHILLKILPYGNHTPHVHISLFFAHLEFLNTLALQSFTTRVLMGSNDQCILSQHFSVFENSGWSLISFPIHQGWINICHSSSRHHFETYGVMPPTRLLKYPLFSWMKV
jgi:hypothetical protein